MNYPCKPDIFAATYEPDAGMSTVEIDGVGYPTPPQVAGLLQAISEERDELIANNKLSNSKGGA